MSVVLVVALIVVWFGQATWLSHVMDGRGFHRLPWFAVLILLGPAMWPLAVVELISGPPGPVGLRRGNPRDGRLDVFVALDRNDVPKATATQLRRLAPNCRRVVLGRVIKAGGPTYIRADAERFLSATRRSGSASGERSSNSTTGTSNVSSKRSKTAATSASSCESTNTASCSTGTAHVKR